MFTPQQLALIQSALQYTATHGYQPGDVELAEMQALLEAVESELAWQTVEQ